MERAYNRRMPSPIRPFSEYSRLARDRAPEAMGPQDENEQRLQALIHEGLQAGPAINVGIDDLADQLRARIHARSAKAR
ncbi:hypothetical protein HWE04_14425 [Herbaspirillum sp. C7C2]|uniref:hypothetical protein n=1 Tax=Herbaspirillum sp. C7C2 TaxID=2736666 RepID=UPI001F52AE73|nr:hypothetical protein [Herbaspirillum sp. C7C2]MCI1015048.1 hypothetical protein [Herbaspirillum sp. C7C2]